MVLAVRNLGEAIWGLKSTMQCWHKKQQKRKKKLWKAKRIILTWTLYWIPTELQSTPIVLCSLYALYAVLEYIYSLYNAVSCFICCFRIFKRFTLVSQKSETACFDFNFELYGAVFSCFTCSFGILTYQRFALVSQKSETAYFDFDFAYNLVV